MFAHGGGLQGPPPCADSSWPASKLMTHHLFPNHDDPYILFDPLRQAVHAWPGTRSLTPSYVVFECFVCYIINSDDDKLESLPPIVIRWFVAVTETDRPIPLAVKHWGCFPSFVLRVVSVTYVNHRPNEVRDIRRISTLGQVLARDRLTILRIGECGCVRPQGGCYLW